MTLTLDTRPQMAPSAVLLQEPPHPGITLAPWQYRLTATPHPGAEKLGAFWLSVGPGLPLTRVYNCAGKPAGVLLGFPIDLDAATLVHGVWTMPEGTDLTEAGVHRALRRLGGQYIWICLTPTFARIYPDAIAQVTCVWDRNLKTAGATTLAILDTASYDARFDAALFERLGVLGEGWFPAGLTAHKDVHRLLPNHFLDLTSWTAQRIQVVPEPQRRLCVEDSVTAMVVAIQTQMAALFKGPKSPVVALTAGRDSRAILACLRPWIAQIKTVTVVGSDRHQVDTFMAKRIAAELGLDHIPLPRQMADSAAQELFLQRGGHCFGDSNMAYHPSILPLVNDHVFAGGVGGEIAQGFYRKTTDTRDLIVTPQLLLGRMGLRPDRKVIAQLQIWLDGLPGAADALKILDLAYLELRQGPWGAAQFCADPTLVRYAPMITYDTVQLMLALPDDWKNGKRLNTAIVARMWPALNAYPYNTLGPLRDTWATLQRVLKNPALLTKKIRQRLS